ncbi:hypothetical protein ITJ38_06830 [Agreia pratensis]|uniref:hypothetical protein n=1 Tax=Agreia pratensis TaxID=150121 RepID=UPI00188C12C1|nr:hypothetical protein [Agreia pratensis]MBF4634115.1 hypothetical protein [Agreia pratensis]
MLTSEATEVEIDPIPAYGTPDGDPVDESVPVYGTPTFPVPPSTDRPPLIRRETLAEKIRRATGRAVRLLGSTTRTDDLDWSAYPGLTAGDSADVLSGIRLDDVLARTDEVLSRVRGALEAEFRVHWWANTDVEALELRWNAWGGESLLRDARSATWRTTSGLTSIEDRYLAARIVGVALTHHGFAEEALERHDDEWVMTARSAEPPESLLELHIGFSEFELSMTTRAVLAFEDEPEFRRRAQLFTHGDR